MATTKRNKKAPAKSRSLAGTKAKATKPKATKAKAMGTLPPPRKPPRKRGTVHVAFTWNGPEDTVIFGQTVGEFRGYLSREMTWKEAEAHAKELLAWLVDHAVYQDKLYRVKNWIINLKFVPASPARVPVKTIYING